MIFKIKKYFTKKVVITDERGKEILVQLYNNFFDNEKIKQIKRKKMEIDLL